MQTASSLRKQSVRTSKKHLDRIQNEGNLRNLTKELKRKKALILEKKQQNLRLKTGYQREKLIMQKLVAALTNGWTTKQISVQRLVTEEEDLSPSKLNTSAVANARKYGSTGLLNSNSSLRSPIAIDSS